MYYLPPPGRFHGHHAIVIGGSMAGLVAARILSAHFDRVTIYDRDALPDEIENRRGVPQGRHGHGLLASGLRGLKALFPDLERDLLEGGAVAGDVLGNFRWFQHGYYKAKFPSGFDGLLLSRPLLEVTLRRQVMRLPNVRIVDNTRIAGLVTEGGSVRGVRVVQLKREPCTVLADLVVDAGGRGSRSPEWLEELGYGRPEVDEVSVGIGYTTRIYRRVPGDFGGDVGAVIAPKPPREMRIGFILAMEGERWMVTLGGWLGNHCPPEPEAFLEFARSLARPDIYDLISRAEPLTDAVTYGFPSNLRRRYDRYTKFPGRYLVMGDAMCSFNPLYGQGMSVATLEALALRECLENSSSCEAIWRPFFKATREIVDTPWMIAAGSDFAFEGVSGPRPVGNRAINWYLERVHRAASIDRQVCRSFFDAANLLAPASVMFRPGFVARVARACLLHPPAAPGVLTDTERHRLAETH
jgi:2-polyprenyl-6-methoxyphenol hydroxylase-like FAD-dependent oxidoreductase